MKFKISLLVLFDFKYVWKSAFWEYLIRFSSGFTNGFVIQLGFLFVCFCFSSQFQSLLALNFMLSYVKHLYNVQSQNLNKKIFREVLLSSLSSTIPFCSYFLQTFRIFISLCFSIASFCKNIQRHTCIHTYIYNFSLLS